VGGLVDLERVAGHNPARKVLRDSQLPGFG
jgi:hypothetical protein